MAQAAIRCTPRFSLLCMPRHLQIMGWRACGFRGKGILKNHQGLPLCPRGGLESPASCAPVCRRCGSLALLSCTPCQAK